MNTTMMQKGTIPESVSQFFPVGTERQFPMLDAGLAVGSNEALVERPSIIIMRARFRVTDENDTYLAEQ
jgi:hypothetical protein